MTSRYQEFLRQELGHDEIDKDSLWRIRKYISSSIISDLRIRDQSYRMQTIARDAIDYSFNELIEFLAMSRPEIEWIIFRNTTDKIIEKMRHGRRGANYTPTNTPLSDDYSHIDTVAFLYRNLADELIFSGSQCALDIGGGDGHFALCALIYLTSIGYDTSTLGIVSTDLNRDRMRHVDCYIEKLGVPSTIKIAKLDFEARDLASQVKGFGADFFILTHIIEHIPSLERALAALERLLDANPRVVALSVPYDDPPETSISPDHHIGFTKQSFADFVNTAVRIRGNRLHVDDENLGGGLVFIKSAK